MLNGLKDRMLNISSSAKRTILISAIFAAVALVLICSVTFACKKVVIIDGANSAKEVITFNRYVEDVLKSEGIALGTNDKMNVSNDAVLKDNMKIEIYRAFHVYVTEKGNTTEHISTRRTVGEILGELGYNAK